jgi:hypothetical protein
MASTDNPGFPDKEGNLSQTACSEWNGTVNNHCPQGHVYDHYQQCPRGNQHCGFLRGEGCSLEAVCCELDSLGRRLEALKEAT